MRRVILDVVIFVVLVTIFGCLSTSLINSIENDIVKKVKDNK